MNGRVYDYRLGRFLSVDPIISDPTNPQAVNPYSYIGNNPLSGTDPTGYMTDDTTGCGRFSKCQVYGTMPGQQRYELRDNGKVVATGTLAQVLPTLASWFNGGGNTATATLPNTSTTDHGGPRDTANADLNLGNWGDKLPIGGRDQGSLASAGLQVLTDTGVGTAKELANTVIGMANTVNRPIDAGLSLFTDFRFGQIPYFEGSTLGEKSAMTGIFIASMLVGPGEIRVAGKAVEAYEVGRFDLLRLRSLKGDGLDLHHIGQAHAMEQVIPGYNRLTAPAIALPRLEHAAIPALKGPVSLSARDLLARDLMNLRLHTSASNSSLRELIRLNKEMYPGAFAK